MISKIHSIKMSGDKVIPVTIEVKISSGIGIHIVGLSDQALKETLLRTITAMQNLGFRIPAKKITINIAPADLTKTSEYYDLPIAAGIIAASGQMELPFLEDYIVVGRLQLDSTVSGDTDAFAASELAEQMNLKGCILPVDSVQELKKYPAVPVYGETKLEDVLDILADLDTLIGSR